MRCSAIASIDTKKRMHGARKSVDNIAGGCTFANKKKIKHEQKGQTGQRPVMLFAFSI